MMSKKGISGLVVAVLLLAISLTIGGLVMGWMSSFASNSLDGATAEQLQQRECLARSFKIISANVSDQTSTIDINKTVTIRLENKGDDLIKGFMFKFTTVGEDMFAIEAKTLANNIGGYERKTYMFNHSSIDKGNGQPFTTIVHGRKNPESEVYQVSKIEVVPIIDVVSSDGTEEVICDGNSKIIKSNVFVQGN